MSTVDQEPFRRIEDLDTREWLETNGLGGYASGTVAGLHTRRYHGLLVAATKPPVGRAVLLSKFEEVVHFGARRFEISCHRYPDAIHPEGYRYLKNFWQRPFPVWTFDLDGVLLERELCMVHGQNTIVCRWRLLSDMAGVRLELRPLLAFRDHHHLRQSWDDFDTNCREQSGNISVRPAATLPEVTFAHNAIETSFTGHWYRNFEYELERERGFDHHEDLHQPFVLKFELQEQATVVVSTEELPVKDADALIASEMRRRERLVSISDASDTDVQQLVLAADQFIVARGAGQTVIAGYHWFSDWGRDTMISLPGLTLATGRPEIAREILLEYSRHISMGMLPNRFPDEGGKPDYNTVDATLWYFEALRSHTDATGDLGLVQRLFGKLVDIIDWHLRGTRYGIRVDDDGLLLAGEEGSQLTWMDAKVGDRVITPRCGKPVEIQALWYNALCITAEFAENLGFLEAESRIRGMAARARASFENIFWNDEQKCLYDVVAAGGADASIRPNQLFAASLHYPLIQGDTARHVVERVERDLLTPYGLRTLAPGDPRYVGRYEGSPEKRDAAYHQGTVWAWLIGPFIDAYRRVHAGEAKVEERVAGFLAPLRKHISDAMLGSISEIFDGDAPHHPRGCASQAWSVAEVLRVGHSRE
jgi:predicted glycogen debranching enzyme